MSDETPVEGWIPVYLPDRTVIGKALVHDDGVHATMELDMQTPIKELLGHDLIGLSIVYQRREAYDVEPTARDLEREATIEERLKASKYGEAYSDAPKTEGEN